jgi:hypothetical protein
MSSLKSTALMFLALLASYALEFAVILLLPQSPTSLRLLPLAAYAPAGIAALWSVSGGIWYRVDRIIRGRRLADSMKRGA